MVDLVRCNRCYKEHSSIVDHMCNVDPFLAGTPAQRTGPALRVEGSCKGCRWHFETEYDDNSDDVRQCLHGAVPRTIDDAGKATPVWCPELPAAQRALAVGEAERAEEQAREERIAKRSVFRLGEPR